MRRQLVYIAIRNEAKSNLPIFLCCYVSVCTDEADHCDMMTAEDDLNSTSLLTSIRLSEDMDSVPNLDSKTEDQDEISETSLSHQLDTTFGDLKTELTQQDPQFMSGVKKVIDRCKKMRNSTAVIASSLLKENNLIS